MNNYLEQQVIRGRLLERVILQAIQINELEMRLLKRNAKKAAKKIRRQRCVQLQCLAELDQITANVRQQIENQEKT